MSSEVKQVSAAEADRKNKGTLIRRHQQDLVTRRLAVIRVLILGAVTLSGQSCLDAGAAIAKVRLWAPFSQKTNTKLKCESHRGKTCNPTRSARLSS